MESLRGASSLKDEWVKVKENLKGVDENIMKLCGRDPNQPRPLQRRVSRGGADGDGTGGVRDRVTPAGRLFGEARRIINNPNREPIGPRGGERTVERPYRTVSLDGAGRVGGIQSRLGPKRRRESDDGVESSQVKPAVQSSVVIQQREAPKREDSIALQTDKKGIARNRRMFGALLGTLQQFQTDSKKKEDKDKRRAEVEKKLELKQKNEKMELQREKAALWQERKAKERELKQLEHKMRIVRMFEAWERQTRKQANFIKTTRGKAYVFYKPKVMLPANDKALHNTEEFIEGLIRDRKAKLEKEIEQIMSRPSNRVRERRRSRSADRSRGRREVEESGGEEESEEGSEDELESDTDSATDGDDEQEVEDGELPPARKRHRKASEPSTAPDLAKVKQEREEPARELMDVVIKQEVGEDGVDKKVGEEDSKTSQEQEESEAVQEVGMAPQSSNEQEKMEIERVDKPSGKEGVERVSRSRTRSPITGSKKRSRDRDSSSSSRSRSSKPTTRKSPPTRKPQKKKGGDKSSGESSSSGGSASVSDSNTGSGSSSSSSGSSDSDSGESGGDSDSESEVGKK